MAENPITPDEVDPEIREAAQRIVDEWGNAVSSSDGYWSACNRLSRLTGRVIPHQAYTALNIAKGYLK